MRNKREEVWCILLSVGDCRTGGGRLGSVSEYGCESGTTLAGAAAAGGLPSTAGEAVKDCVEGVRKTGFFTGLAGSEAGREPGARDRRASELRGRMTGSEMLAKAVWVLSKAAAASENMPLDDRCCSRGIEFVDGEVPCREA